MSEKKAAYLKDWAKKNRLKLREYQRNYMREYRKKYPERHRAWAKASWRKLSAGERKARCHKSKLARFGLTPSDYFELGSAQGWACAICARKISGRSACVDHAHRSGRVRALLCSQCNVGLGMFGDSPEQLEAAAAYLRGFPEADRGRAESDGQEPGETPQLELF